MTGWTIWINFLPENALHKCAIGYISKIFLIWFRKWEISAPNIKKKRKPVEKSRTQMVLYILSMSGNLPENENFGNLAELREI